ncbi:MAG: right-handed parallel beta-helix repeat-containing protein [Verrucomicrobiota bacterium]|nr:right-handed parallel beta-helix repeat-containing protein [Limisphaera sp.]MDW8380747.1 right-handed parallel beta-helix repeat-containing protein [Verrucomicrobiota bacterium]
MKTCLCILLWALTALPLAQAATAYVTRTGTTWTGRVDGNVVYTGSSYNAAIQACVNNMTSGTIYIRNSGTCDPDYGVAPKDGLVLDYGGTTATGTASTISVIQLDRRNNVTIRNLRIAGNPRYGIWSRSSSGITLSGCSAQVTGGLPFRFDDSKGGGSRNINVNSITSNGQSAHGLETYTVDGFYWTTLQARDSTGCGLLLNNTLNWSGGSVYAYNCCYGGGYAGFRMANSNQRGTVNYVDADRCGRGIFSLTQSRDATINNCNVRNCSGIGIWLQDSYNTRVLAGTVANNAGGCYAITGGSGNSVQVTCQ